MCLSSSLVVVPWLCWVLFFAFCSVTLAFCKHACLCMWYWCVTALMCCLLKIESAFLWFSSLVGVRLVTCLFRDNKNFTNNRLKGQTSPMFTGKWFIHYNQILLKHPPRKRKHMHGLFIFIHTNLLHRIFIRAHVFSNRWNVAFEKSPIFTTIFSVFSTLCFNKRPFTRSLLRSNVQIMHIR